MHFKLRFIIIVIMMYSVFGKRKKEPLAECSTPLKSQEIDKQPLYLVKDKNKDFNFAKPVLKDGKAHIVVQDSESLIFVCPIKKPLVQEFTNTEILKAKCINGQWNMSSKMFKKELSEKLPDQECEQQITFTTKERKKGSCAENTKIYEIGVHVYLKPKSIFGMKTAILGKALSTYWFPLYRVCFNIVNKFVIYATHTVYGASTRVRQTGIIESTKFKYGTEYDYDKGTINPESSYKLENMKKEYVNELRNVSKFNFERKHWIPGMLVPDSDMLFLNWKTASYFYINTAPFWMNMECAWRKLEEKIRKVATMLNADLTIYTGIYEDFQINDVPVTLAEGRYAINVPLFFWKIIYREKDNSGIAFVLNNNPYSTTHLCQPHKEAEKTWNISNELPMLGRLYSCSVADLVDELKRKYKMPEFSISEHLMFPSKPELSELIWNGINQG